MNPNFVIYKITSPNGKVYIGRTNDFYDRMKSHKYRSTKDVKWHLYNAIRKYGWDNMIKEIIDEADTIEEAITKELKYILEYNSVLEGYNSMYQTEDGGDIWDGLRDTDKYYEFVKNQSILSSGENNAMYGKKHRPESIELQKQKAKGRFSLDWFIERYGEEGRDKYQERCDNLRKRKDIEKGSDGRYRKVLA